MIVRGGVGISGAQWGLRSEAQSPNSIPVALVLVSSAHTLVSLLV